jgi:hypothetical protein
VLTENDYTLKMWPHQFKAVSCNTKQTGTSEGQLLCRTHKLTQLL